MGGEYLYSSSQFYRGDEANENNKIEGHSVVNVYLNYDISSQLALSLQLDNVFNHQYYTFGTYGESEEVLGDIYPDISSVEFVGPAKPRAFAVSLNYLF